MSFLAASLLGSYSGAAAAGLGTGAPSTSVAGDSCNGIFHGSPPGSLVETTSAGPNDNAVTPGQVISVTLTWNPSDFGGNPPSKTDMCVEIGSQIWATLSQEHKPGPSGVTDTFDFTVPGDTGGLPICARAAVSGPITSTEKSGILCYAVLAAATPEAPSVLLFPLLGLCIVAALLLVRRYRARPSSDT